MKKFEFLEHVSDAYVAAYGSSLEEAFANAALGMFEVMLDTGSVEPRIRTRIEVEGEDLKSLLYAWLEELLFKFEVEGLALSKFEVKSIERTKTGYKLTAEVAGEAFNEKRHSAKVGIKAVTYHLMRIRKRGDKVEVRVLFDI